MRDQFPEYYALPDESLNRLYREGTIVLDANVLLSLYEIGGNERSEVLGVFRDLADRLWVPYQAALEFHRNRPRVIRSQRDPYKSVRSKFDKGVDEALKELGSNSVGSEQRADMQAALAKAQKKFHKRIDRSEAEHTFDLADALRDDPIRNELDEILRDRVGAMPGDRSELVAEGVRRAKAKVPPGYEDIGKETDERVAGDFLVWTEILRQADGSTTGTLFVTNDSKGDWMQKVGDRTIGPRPELRSEFSSVCEHPYHHQTLGQFLAFARTLLESKVADRTIGEVEEVARRWVSAADMAMPRLDEETRRRLLGIDRPEATWFLDAAALHLLDEETRRRLLGIDRPEATRHLDAAALHLLDEETRRRLLGIDRPEATRYFESMGLDETSRKLFGIDHYDSPPLDDEREGSRNDRDPEGDENGGMS